MPKKLRDECAADLDYRFCARFGQGGHTCDGRITWEHAARFAGRQVQKKWAIVSLCAKGHAVDQFQDGGDLDKEVNMWIALNQASDEDLWPVSTAVNYFERRTILNKVYGPFRRKYPVMWDFAPDPMYI